MAVLLNFVQSTQTKQNYTPNAMKSLWTRAKSPRLIFLNTAIIFQNNFHFITIEIGLEHPPFVFWFIFSSFEHAKKPADYEPHNTKNSSLKCDFLILNYE